MTGNMAIANGFVNSYVEALKDGVEEDPQAHWAALMVTGWVAEEYHLFDRFEFMVWLGKRNGILDAFRVQWDMDPNVEIALAWMDLIEAKQKGIELPYTNLPACIERASTEQRLVAFRVIARLALAVLKG